MTSSEELAELLYLAVYGRVAQDADVLEPEHGPDLLLPEALIAAVSATVLTSLATGFFEELGRAVAERVRRRPFRKSEVVHIDPEEAVALLAGLLRSGTLRVSRSKEARDAVQTTLEELGINATASARTAAAVVEAFERELAQSSWRPPQ